MGYPTVETATFGFQPRANEKLDEYVDVTPSETVTTPNRDDDTATDNQSTGSNCCSSMTFSDLSSGVQAETYSAVAPDIESERKVEDDVVSLPLTQETLKMRKC